jgi:hypothetical protein
MGNEKRLIDSEIISDLCGRVMELENAISDLILLKCTHNEVERFFVDYIKRRNLKRFDHAKNSGVDAGATGAGKPEGS